MMFWTAGMLITCPIGHMGGLCCRLAAQRAATPTANKAIKPDKVILGG